jgi:Flp pilus assembly pilin Flp
VTIRTLRRDERGATVVETAFALPVLVVMIWMLVQLAQVYRAMSGIQHGLGEGARQATLWPQPSTSVIVARINAAVYGIGPGTFTVPTPGTGVDGAARYLDLEVSYTQTTNLLLFPGPTITVTRRKRVWVAN